MNKLNKLYESMLSAWGTVIKPDYSLVMMLDGVEYPITVDGKQTYLPTDSVLDSNTMDKVFFHPACESIISSETEIFKVIRKLTGMTLLQSFTRYPMVLFSIASKKSTKSMSGEIMEILEPLRALKQTEHKEIADLFSLMTVTLDDETLDKRFIHFKVSKGGKSRVGSGKVYYRVKPQFPFYVEMARKLNRNEDLPRNQKVEVNGMRITLKALEGAVHLFRSVFPGIDSPEQYEGESHKASAARLVAFCESYAQVVDEMNTLQNLFRADFDKAGIYGLENSFNEQLETIEDFYRQVPPMPYNNQSSTGGTKSPSNALIDSVVNTEKDYVEAHTQPQAQTTQTQTTQPSMQTDPDNKMFINEVIASMRPGETYQSGYFDQAQNFFIHQTMSAQGPVIYKVTRAGNLLSREAGFMQPQQQYPGYPMYQQQMMQQGFQPPMYGGYPMQQQPQQQYYGGAMAGGSIQPVGNNGQVTTF